MAMFQFEIPAQIAKQQSEHHATNGNGRPDNGQASFAGRSVVTKAVTSPESRLRLFEEVILPHLNSAYNLARWITRNEQDAQDVVQESYLRAFRFFDSYRGGDGKSWLLEVVRNTCFTFLRRERRNSTAVAFDEKAHTPNVSRPNAEETLVEEGNRQILRSCIEALPEPFREVLVMRELEEMSYQQIADVAGVPSGTVMSRLSRARKRLEECAKGRNMEFYR
jgi:RNA polymerase sigma-70 factor (ECF subfamily)